MRENLEKTSDSVEILNFNADKTMAPSPESVHNIQGPSKETSCGAMSSPAFHVFGVMWVIFEFDLPPQLWQQKSILLPSAANLADLNAAEKFEHSEQEQLARSAS